VWVFGFKLVWVLVVVVLVGFICVRGVRVCLMNYRVGCVFYDVGYMGYLRGSHSWVGGCVVVVY